MSGLGFLLVALCAYGQSGSESLSIPVENLPKPSLWQPYYFRLPASGGVGPYHWHLISGSLPAGLKLADDGEFAGTPQETGQFEFNVLLADSDSPPKQLHKRFTLLIETPLAVEWGRKANVNGQRIEGSIKVSNDTGRDFDLTVIVLAVWPGHRDWLPALPTEERHPRPGDPLRRLSLPRELPDQRGRGRGRTGVQSHLSSAASDSE